MVEKNVIDANEAKGILSYITGKKAAVAKKNKKN